STMTLQHEGRPLVASIFHDVTEARQQEREASVLVQIASSLTLNQPLEATLNTLSQSILRATKAVASSVTLVERDTLDLRTVGAAGFPDGALEAYVSTWTAATDSDSKVVRALLDQETYVINDVVSKNLANPNYA